jgi:hypothetical protein
MNFKVLAIAASVCVSQSFAIFGLGVNYAPNFGTSLDKTSPATVLTLESNGIETGHVDYAHSSFSGMQGLGLKFWIDVIPFIDIEATYNVQWASYDATLYVYDAGNSLVKEQSIELEFNNVPFGKATPKYVAMNGDLSITYPITSIPIIRPYIGGGLTYYLSTPVMSQKFVEKFMANGGEALLSSETMTSEDGKVLAEALSSQLQDEGLNTSIGGHAIIGVRAKFPVIPIAIYVNGKYYFGGNFDDEIEFGHIALEAGIGLAI